MRLGFLFDEEASDDKISFLMEKINAFHLEQKVAPNLNSNFGPRNKEFESFFVPFQLSNKKQQRATTTIYFKLNLGVLFFFDKKIIKPFFFWGRGDFSEFGVPWLQLLVLIQVNFLFMFFGGIST